MNIHKRAVQFRNKKREQYLKGELPVEHKRFVEDWDIIREKDGSVRWKPRLLTEEPLSLDIFIKVIGK